MLISGVFFLFVACIVYMHADMSISKSSASYLAKLQWDEVSSFSVQYLIMICNCTECLLSGLCIVLGASSSSAGPEYHQSMLSNTR